MSEILKISDELTVVIDDDFNLHVKKNGLTISITPEEMESFEKRLKGLANKIEADIIDSINQRSGREL